MRLFNICNDVSIIIMYIVGSVIIFVSAIIGIFECKGIGWSVLIGQLIVVVSIFIYYLREKSFGEKNETHV